MTLAYCFQDLLDPYEGEMMTLAYCFQDPPDDPIEDPQVPVDHVRPGRVAVHGPAGRAAAAVALGPILQRRRRRLRHEDLHLPHAGKTDTVAWNGS